MTNYKFFDNRYKCLGCFNPKTEIVFINLSKISKSFSPEYLNEKIPEIIIHEHVEKAFVENFWDDWLYFCIEKEAVTVISLSGETIMRSKPQRMKNFIKV